MIRPSVCGDPARDPAGVTRLTQEYWAATEELVDRLEREYGSDNFTVVLQPLMTDTQVRGVLDASYLAPDCFHISGKGHQIAGIAAWQNLLAPRAEKVTTFSPVEGDGAAQIRCPTLAYPYLNTRRNEQLAQQPPPAPLGKAASANASRLNKLRH